MTTQNTINKLTYEIIGYAIDVHSELGPGLLESVYETCMEHLLKENGHKVIKQNEITFSFRGLNIDTKLRFDLLVDDLIIIENKSVAQILPIHEAQILTYINLLKIPKGILINFNCKNIFKEGQKTFVNKYFAALPKE
jgi:GxxExxY protein